MNLIKTLYKNTLVKQLLLAMLALPLSSVLAVAESKAATASKNEGRFYGDFRLRYETVSQDNALADAAALTLRARVGYKTAELNGFSAVLEGEATVEAIDDFSVPPAGVRPGQFSVIADPESEEVDQAYIQYKGNGLTAKVGRQVLTLDGHRFVGHVGWRQDRQTFDGATLVYKPSDKFVINASYIAKRNRIFADQRDIDSEDTLLNTSYFSAIGKVVAYAYLLEIDNGTSNSLDTVGLSLNGKRNAGDVKFLYTAEYASQEVNNSFDTDYVFVEGGVALSGVTAKLGFEALGSDGGQKGFATPLATLHKFNGWADVFLATPDAGLQDLYVSLAGSLGGGKWLAAYHDFSADVALSGADDLGDEFNVQYTRKFNDSISGGLKLADYSAGDAAFNKVDTDKAWVWASVKF